jgi:predicted transcriptional regulator
MHNDPGNVTEPDQELLGYIERFASVLIAAGFPPMPARVFVALLVADAGRLSAAGIGAMLSISPAAVSGAVRYLVQLGIVHKERVPGSRRDYYRMPDNVWQEMLRMRDLVLRRWIALIQEGMELVGPGSPASARLADHAAFIGFVVEEYPEVMERWEKRKPVAGT